MLPPCYRPWQACILVRALKCLSNCLCTGAHALSLTVLGLSATGLALSEVPELVEQLRKFPALKRLDVSANPALDCGAVSAIVRAVSGNAQRCNSDLLFIAHFNSLVCLECTH